MVRHDRRPDWEVRWPRRIGCCGHGWAGVRRELLRHEVAPCTMARDFHVLRPLRSTAVTTLYRPFPAPVPRSLRLTAAGCSCLARLGPSLTRYGVSVDLRGPSAEAGLADRLVVLFRDAYRQKPFASEGLMSAVAELDTPGADLMSSASLSIAQHRPLVERGRSPRCRRPVERSAVLWLRSWPGLIGAEPARTAQVSGDRRGHLSRTTQWSRLRRFHRRTGRAGPPGC